MTIAENRTLGYGIAGSLAVHLVMFCVLATWMSLAPARVMEPPPEPEPVVQMVFADNIVTEPLPEPVPEKPDSARYVRTTQNEKNIEPPTKADFISDRNTTASAKLPAEAGGDPQLPSMKGVNVPTLELTNREYKEGEIKNDSAPVPPPVPPAPQPPMTKPQEAPPEKNTREPEAKMSKDEGAEHLPLEVRTADNPPRAIPLPAMKAPDEDAPPTTPPVPPAPPVPKPEKNAFVPQTRTAQTKGSAGNQGDEDALNAMETMEGRYMRQIHEAIGVRWHKLVATKRDFAKPGIFSVSFLVYPDGSVKSADIRVNSNGDNVVLESVAIKSILDAKIPPIPRELLRTLDRGSFSAVMNFLIGN